MKRLLKVAVIAVTVILSAFMLFSCAKNSAEGEKTTKYISSIEELAGKRIGVPTDATCYNEVIAKIPDIKVDYYDTTSEMLAALISSKIDAFVTDGPVADMLFKSYPELGIVGRLSDDSYGYIFPLGHDELCKQMNEFLVKLKKEGTLDEIKDIWTGDDEEKKTIDLSCLSGENGILDFCTSSETGEPFAYKKDGKCVGYDIDIAVRFCREYGYGINIYDTTFAGLLTGVTNNKYDFGASCVSITDERKKTLLISQPDYVGEIVVVSITDDSDISGKKVGVLTGSVFDEAVKSYNKDAEVCYYNSSTDTAAALESGKIYAYCCDEPVARVLIKQYKNQKISKLISKESYGFIFQKDNERSDRICTELNEFIQKSKKDGTIDELDKKWFGDDEKIKIIDFDKLTGENGNISLCVNSDGIEPFGYFKNGTYIGFDVDLIYRFCLYKGYALDITSLPSPAIIPGIVSGKADIGASCFTITEERKKAVLFTDPYYYGGSAIVVNDYTKTTQKSGFFKELADNFKKTFIVENRWELYIVGLATTLLITISSALLGTALGFVFYLVYRKRIKLVNRFTDAAINILGRMPVVVILMVLFYVIFGSSDIGGIWVSIIAFTLLFSSTVTGLLKTSVSAVDIGQTEAALALGYTPMQAFMKIVLPQAVRYFLPGYNDSIVSLIKDTAIVGYISVQDLTKVSDIIRSRTFEAFFSIISTAIIYFAAASLLAFIVNLIGRKADNRRRSREKILSGVKTK